MSEDQVYKDGDIVWVKLGNNWWPGEVIDAHRHPDGVVKNIKRKLYCIVKFFNENAYEYVSNLKQIYPFQCAKKEEFLRKGFSLYKSGNKFMEKFPEDVDVAERLTRHKTPSLYINDRPDSIVKAILGQPLVLSCDNEYRGSSEYREKRRSSESITKIINITPNKPSVVVSSTAATSIRIEPDSTTAYSSYGTKANANNVSIPPRTSFCESASQKSVNNASNNYRCNLCEFTSVRQNVMILHRKMHSNRNGPPIVSMASRPNLNHNRNKSVNNNNKNTKVITSVVAKTLCPATTTPNIVTSTISPKIPTKTISNETIEFTNSSKKYSSKVTSSECCISNELDILSAVPSETLSRRSTRNTKTTTTIPKSVTDPPANNILNGSTISIDLPETKPIKKIPKKRDFANLNLQQLQDEYEIPPMAQEVQISASNTSVTALGAVSSVTKDNAEEIRNMLLADWSDEDETADHERNEKEKHLATPETNDKNVSNNEMTSQSTDVAITSTPPTTSKSPNTGRIRNIPKKDRRDVILQDFGSDISIIEPEKESTNQNPVVHLDSSNSSAVEVLEEQQPPIITINDDEEDAKDNLDVETNIKSNKIKAKLSPAHDMEHVDPNDKSIVASILSCFDFQDDEDEDDVDTPASVATSIAHFKKKYLSTEKSQSLISIDSEISRAAKEKHEERAQKDQELTAEIESLLEQTQPPAAADLLTSTNSFEENMSVKDLPIKERGKRIFKSRNRSRIEGKSSTESLINSISAEDSLTKDISSNLMNSKPLITKRRSTENQTKVRGDSVINHSPKDYPKSFSDDVGVSQKEEQLQEQILICEEVTNEGNSKGVDKYANDNEKNISDISENENSAEAVIDIDSHCNENNISDISPNNELEVVYVSAEDNPNEETKNKDVIKENENCETLYNTSTVESIEPEHKAVKNTAFTVLSKEMSTENIEVSIDQNEIVDNLPPADKPVDSQVIEIDDIAIVEEYTPIQKDLTLNVTTTEESPIEESKLNDVNENLNLYSANESERCSEKNSNVKDISNVHVNIMEEKSNDHSILNETNKNLNTTYDLDRKIHKNLGTNSILAEVQGQVVISEVVINEDKQNDVHHNVKVGETHSASESRIKSCERNEESVDGVYKKCKSPITTILPEHEQAPAEEITTNRLINMSPIDENSSMGASDTGAEFGSPASMLSEERLPTFPFKRNETPQQENEVTENVSSVELTKNTDKPDIDMVNVECNKSPKESVAGECKVSGDERTAFVEKKMNTTTTNINVCSKTEDIVNIRETAVDQISSTPTGTVSLERETVKTSRNSPVSDNREKSHIKKTPRLKTKEVFKDYEDCTQSPVDMASEVNKVIVPSESMQERKNDGLKAPIVVDTDAKSENGLKKSMLKDQEESSNKRKSQDSKLSTSQTKENCTTDTSNNITEEFSDKTTYRSKESEVKHDTLSKITITQTQANQGNKIVETSNTAENTDDTLVTKPNATSQEEMISKEETIIESSGNIDTTDRVENEIRLRKKDDATGNDQSNYINTDNKVSGETTVIRQDNKIKEEDEDVSEPLGTHRKISDNKTDEQLTNDISVGRPSNRDIKTNDDQNIKDNNASETVTNNNKPISCIGICKQKKRSGETILLAKKKHRKYNEKTTKNEYNPNNSGNIEDANIREIREKDNVERTTSKSDESNFSRSDNKSDDIVVFQEEIPEDRSDNVPKSPIDSNPSIISKSIITNTENKSVDIDGPNKVFSPSADIDAAMPQETEICSDESERIITKSELQQEDVIVESNTIDQTTIAVIDFDKKCASPNLHDKNEEDEEKTSPCVENQSSTDQDHQIAVDYKVVAEIDDTDKNVVLTQLTTTQEDLTITESTTSNASEKDITTVSQPIMTEADKATHDFLVEFDNLVNKTTKGNEIVLNTEDINNIVEVVQEDNSKQTNISETNSAAMTTAVEFDGKDEATNISQPIAVTSQRPFYRQTTPIKRRQTLCYDLSESSVSRKRQILDFEDELPATLTVHRRTAERKMTMPETETPSFREVSPLDFESQFNAFRPRRRSSIEDNIASFLIQRPNAEKTNEALFPDLIETATETSCTGRTTYKQLSIDSIGNKIVVIKNPTSPDRSKTETKAANGRGTKRKGRRSSIHADQPPPHSKMVRDATDCLVKEPKISKTELVVPTLNDNQISTAQQQLIQLQQQQPQTQSSSIILNKNSSRTRKTHKTPPAIQNSQQHHNSNQLVVQQIPVQQLQQQQAQQQVITQVAGQQNVLQLAVTQPVAQQQQLQQVQQTNEGFIITTATPSEDDNVIDSNTQLIALPTQPYPGYTETFLLCKVNGNTCKPVDNVPLYLNHQLNELVPIPSEVLERVPKLSINDISIDTKQTNTQQQLVVQNKECVGQIHVPESEIEDESGVSTTVAIDTETMAHQEFLEENVDAIAEAGEGTVDLAASNGILLNIEGQQVLLDAATFAHLLANPDTNTQLISDDGTEYVLTHEVLQALYMQQQQQQQQQNQVVEIANADVNSDLIAVAMAGSDLYGNGVLTIDTSQAVQLIDGTAGVVFQQASAPAIVQQHLTPPAVVTNAVLDQSPIMSTLEVPSSNRMQASHCIPVPSIPLVAPPSVVLGGNARTNLDDSLAAIGVTAQTSAISSSLGLPITVTDPNIASKVTSAGPLNEILQFVSHRPATAQATAAAVAAAALAGESRIFND